MIEARLSHHGSEEVEEVSEALIQLCQYMQVCNEFGTFQSDSPTGDLTLPGNASITNARGDRRRSTSATPLPIIHEQENTKLESITKVETRSKRNSGIRVLTNTSRLVVDGEVQHSGENFHVDIGEESLEDAHSEPPVVPAVALIAMQSLEFQQRLQKEASRYLYPSRLRSFWNIIHFRQLNARSYNILEPRLLTKFWKNFLIDHATMILY